ncbi:hypothetical protein HPB48_007745 [Haemaphysalis longicornis]|uniref:RNase H type-1 domain-containing protein n=1 Tax=Haemaphysalis longicornis TaxID=44386 RepID=A0A9J6GSB9_HAELO|nr:hypothetical protein HPB48_007745 [Haemaphysalis longicornis]
MITKAFKTASNLSLNIMAKIPPVYLTIEKQIEQYGALKEGKTFSCDDKLYTSNQIMKKYNLWTDHPANKSGIVITPTEEIVDYRIYTDGSKTEKEVRAAFEIIKNNNQIVRKETFQLLEYSSNYEAELIAIKKAKEFIITNKANNSHQLYPDSWSVLQALKTP